MLTIVINPKGTGKLNFARVDEHALFCMPDLGFSVINGALTTAGQLTDADDDEENGGDHENDDPPESEDEADLEEPSGEGPPAGKGDQECARVKGIGRQVIVGSAKGSSGGVS